ncbi:polysaccharide biosynthesis tyrosine autokinase [Marinilabiliaceae bacterium JC017]|nr:polysaccharide biosynthesis tyrosine autokinase [Marinilabiliaceae bacterium JC017]
MRPQTRNDDFSQGGTVDLRKHLHKFLSHWYLFVIFIALASGSAFLINRFSAPVYSASTTLLIRNDKKQAIGAESLIQNFSFSMRNNIQNEIGMLKSYNLTHRTLQSLNLGISYYKRPGWLTQLPFDFLSRRLYKECPIIVELDSLANMIYNVPFTVTILSPKKYHLLLEVTIDEQDIIIDDEFFFDEHLKTDYFNFSVSLANKYSPLLDNPESEIYTHNYIFRATLPTDLTNQFRSALKVDFFFKDANILELTLKGEHPQIISDYLNRLTSTYLISGLEEKNKIANNTIEFIDLQISGISDSLQMAESNFQQFRTSNNVINISTEGDLVMQKMETLVTEKGDLERMAKYYDYLFDYIEGKNDFKDVIVPSTMGVDDAMLNSLVSKISELYSRRALLLMSAREKSPQIKQLNHEIENTRNALLENIRNIIKSTNISISEINRQLRTVEQDIKLLPKTERELITFQRNFKLNDNIYTFLLQKRSEAGIALASNISDHKVLDDAKLENTTIISPRKTQNHIIGLLLGFLIPVIIIVLKDTLNNKITNTYSIQDHAEINILGFINHLKSTKKSTIYASPRSSLAESFRVLRTNLQFIIPEETEKPVIGVTSTIAGEGKTFCASNLATILSMVNKRVLVVGMDLRKPQTHNFFSNDNSKGLSNYLIDRICWKDVVTPTDIPNLYLTPAGPIPPNPAELIESEKMEKFFQAAKREFDVIILDTPPVALVTDAMIIARHTDAMIYVVRQNYSNKQSVQYANDLSRQKKFNNLNLLVNDVRLAAFDGNYNYNYGYGYGNGGGYYED